MIKTCDQTFINYLKINKLNYFLHLTYSKQFTSREIEENFKNFLFHLNGLKYIYIFGLNKDENIEVFIFFTKSIEKLKASLKKGSQVLFKTENKYGDKDIYDQLVDIVLINNLNFQEKYFYLNPYGMSWNLNELEKIIKNDLNIFIIKNLKIDPNLFIDLTLLNNFEEFRSIEISFYFKRYLQYLNFLIENIYNDFILEFSESLENNLKTKEILFINMNYKELLFKILNIIFLGIILNKNYLIISKEIEYVLSRLRKIEWNGGGVLGHVIISILIEIMKERNLLYLEIVDKITFNNYVVIKEITEDSPISINFNLPINKDPIITKYEIEQAFSFKKEKLHISNKLNLSNALENYIKKNNLVFVITLIYYNDIFDLNLFLSILNSCIKDLKYFYIFGLNKDNEKEIKIFFDQKYKEELDVIIIDILVNSKLKFIKQINWTYNLLDIWDSFFLSLFSNLLRLKNTDSLEINTLYGGTKKIKLSENNLINYIYKTWLENLKVDPFYILSLDFYFYGGFERYLIEDNSEYSKKYLRYYQYLNLLIIFINSIFLNILNKYHNLQWNSPELLIKILNIIIIGWIKKIPYKELIEKIEKLFKKYLKEQKILIEIQNKGLYGNAICYWIINLLKVLNNISFNCEVKLVKDLSELNIIDLDFEIIDLSKGYKKEELKELFNF